MLNYSQRKQVSKAPVRIEIQTPWDPLGANTESGRARPSKLRKKQTSFPGGAASSGAAGAAGETNKE